MTETQRDERIHEALTTWLCTRAPTDGGPTAWFWAQKGARELAEQVLRDRILTGADCRALAVEQLAQRIRALVMKAPEVKAALALGTTANAIAT
jgi:hypothetical protein